MAYLIDTHVLNTFQRFSDWSQDTFGTNNFTLARRTREIVILCYGINIFFTFREGENLSATIDILFGILAIGYLGLSFWAIEQVLKLNPLFKNPAAQKLIPFRMVFLLTIGFAFLCLPDSVYRVMHPATTSKEQYHDLAMLFYWLRNIALFVWTYFGSCTPKPKKPSKLKKFVKKMAEDVQSIKERITVPQPTLSTLRR